MKAIRILLPVLFSTALLAGCGSDGHPPVYKAGGKVTVGGKPAAGALVVFHPLDKDRENGVKPVGIAQDDGTFQLTTHEASDGAYAGEYALTIVWNDDGKKAKFQISEGAGGTDRLGGRYGNPRGSTLKKTVSKAGPNSFDLDLK
ncbi:MAG: hypothetical protein NTV55_09025 [Planctomycetota bacterium]|nr:hypothetical protein [Planctomycetota bacterium]